MSALSSTGDTPGPSQRHDEHKQGGEADKKRRQRDPAATVAVHCRVQLFGNSVWDNIIESATLLFHSAFQWFRIILRKSTKSWIGIDNPDNFAELPMSNVTRTLPADPATASVPFSAETVDGDSITRSGVTPTLPGYECIEEIGHGGMGVVYRARDIDLKREVAVKLLLPKYGPDSIASERFLNEARITGQLQHPGIPAVYSIGYLSDGCPFIAMKLTLQRGFGSDR